MVQKSDLDPIYTSEFIGSKIEVTDSEHEGYIGLKGKVVDETKETFVMKNHEERTVPKEGNKFKIEMNRSWKTLDGSKLTYRPENRIKKLG